MNRAYLPPEIHALCAAHPQLTREEERVATKERLVLHGMWIAREGCKRLSRKTLAAGLEPADVFQEGCLGLMRAVETWEPERGLRFSTYAYHWVLQFQRRMIFNAGLVRVPVWLDESKSSRQRAGAEILADALRARRILRESEAEAASEARTEKPGPFLQSLPRGDDQPEWVEEGKNLLAAIANLPPHLRSVAEERFLLGLKLDEISKPRRLSRERARQLVAKAMDLLPALYHCAARRGAGEALEVACA